MSLIGGKKGENGRKKSIDIFVEMSFECEGLEAAFYIYVYVSRGLQKCLFEKEENGKN